MLQHKWTEYRFDSFNEASRCSIQTWRCRTCNQTIDLPHGVNPQDYSTSECKIPVVKPKEKWRSPQKGARR